MQGIFDSNIPNTPAVSATGTNGAEGIKASSDGGGVGVQGVSTGGRERDSAGGVGVAGSAENGGIGVSGQVTGTDENRDPGFGVWGRADSGGIGVRGDASGSNARDRESGPPCGVAGHSPEGVGVRGEAGGAHGVGVAGYSLEGGVGVYAESVRGFAMSAQGPTTQNRESGGWAKALVHVVAPKKGLPVIDRMFNSQPTDIHVYGVAIGVIVIDFGFSVQDRFVTATAEARSAYYAPSNPNDLSQAWNIQAFDKDGNDVAHVTQSPSPPVTLAMISFPDQNLVQVECYTLQIASGAVSYQRANHSIFVSVF